MKIQPNGRGNSKALHITTKVKDCTLHKVLIDNGSSLNIMPMSTLLRLLADMSYIKGSKIMVRAFDSTKREVIGEIEITVQVGHCTFNIRVPSYGHLVVL